MNTLNQDNIATCEHCNTLFDMEDGPFYSGPNTGFYCCEDCIVQAGYEYCNQCDEWHSLENGITIEIDYRDFFFCSDSCLDTYIYENEKDLQLDDKTLKRLTTYYLSCMLELQDEDEELYNYTTFDFYDDAKIRIQDSLQAFNIAALKIGFNISSLDQWTQERFAYDLCLTAQNTGVGFLDRENLYGQDMCVKLDKLADLMPQERTVFVNNGQLDFE